MQLYEVTTAGREIAEESGLQVLAERLANSDRIDPLLDQLSDDYVMGIRDMDKVKEDATQKARSSIRTAEELLALEVGLDIVPDEDKWRHFGKPAEGTMFAIPGIETFSLASERDRFIVSGVVGLQLANFRSQCHLLARTNFEDYGFNNFVEASAFVGAYVLGKIHESEHELVHGESPKFAFSRDRIHHILSVGATVHGDFMLSLDRTMYEGNISPTNKPVEYGPVENVTIVGSNFVEPEVVEAMVVSEFVKNGREGALLLLDEFVRALEILGGPEGSLPYVRGNFADYGDRAVRRLTTRTNLLVSEPDYREKLGQRKHIHSSRYENNTTVLFEIVNTPRGIKFQNRQDGESQEAKCIEIDRDKYQELFIALIGQTQAGLGRTAPMQHVELVLSLRDILLNP